MTDKHETDATPPLDDCERWLEEEYFPKILPSFPPFEHVDRNTAVTFEDRLGVRCTIGAEEIAAAFLALVDNGLLPPVPDTWRELIPEDLMPEVMLNRPTPSPLPLPPERDNADPAQYMAQFVALKVHETALGCPCCGTRAHTVLRTPVSEHQVTKRNVVGAMHQLALANSMPPLSRYWQTRMDEVYEAVEDMTGLEFPWVQQNDDGSKATYYGLCPDCDNAMRLVNPFQTLDLTPHGRHVVEHVPGFTHDLETIQDCPRFKGATGFGGLNDGETAVLTPNGRQVRNTVAENADFAIGILTEDIGIFPSRKLTRTLFRTFFDNLLYLRPNTTPGNAPWLLFGALRTYPLHGQVVRRNSDTAKAILRTARTAHLGAWSRLEAKTGHWVDIRFSLRRHRISGEEPPRETVALAVASHGKDATVTNLLEKTVHLRPSEFLKRIKARPAPTQRGQSYIDIARSELRRHIAERPHLE